MPTKAIRNMKTSNFIQKNLNTKNLFVVDNIQRIKLRFQTKIDTDGQFQDADAISKDGDVVKRK